jgi:hypothetical protein
MTKIRGGKGDLKLKWSMNHDENLARAKRWVRHTEESTMKLLVSNPRHLSLMASTICQICTVN